MTAPAVPDYNSTPAPATASTSSNPADIWGLGNLYGMPVGLGTTSGNHASGGGTRTRGMGIDYRDVGQQNPGTAFGTTQDLLQNMKDLWALGSSGSKPENQAALQQYEELQLMLLQGDHYSSGTTTKNLRFGQWTSATEKAIVDALSGYEQAIAGNATPMTFHDYLAQNRNAGSVGGKSTTDPGSVGGATGAASQAILDDPALLRSTVMSAAQAALGRGLSSAQLDKFVAQFQGAQASYQQSANSTIVRPDAVAQAGVFAQQAAPQQYANHQAQGYMNALLNVFLPSADSRANITPVASVNPA